MAQWVEFTADYDHIWPSRAHTAYKAGMVVFAKKEVAEAAIDAGKAKPSDKPGDKAGVEVYVEDDAAPSKAPDRPRTDGVDERDDAHDVGPRVLDEADEPAAER
jgi:hypothetical protein